MCLSSFALILSSAFSSAQTQCGSNVEASNPIHETLLPDFQPSHYDPQEQTQLMRIRYRPTGSGPWPTVITIPPVLFKTEIGENGTHSQRVAAKDLTDRGFLVFQIEHRLAPPGRATGQFPHRSTQDPARAAASGRPQQQTDDVKQQILAALADPECNQHIYLLGGSSGGYHALFATLDSSHENVTDWGDAVRAKIKAVVGFSGIYALQSRDFGNVGPDFDADTYLGVLRNSTNTTDSFVGLEYQLSVSPQTLVAGATNIPPIRLYASVNDTVPPNQSENMFQALFDHGGVDVLKYIIDSDAHCFNQWNITNNNTSQCVGGEVIDFLEAHP